LAADGCTPFVRWFTEPPSDWLRRRVEGWAQRMGVQPTDIEVRDLGFRWGACGKAGVVNFHWATTLLPAGVVDYVVVHKLAHLVEPNHTEAF
jgi:predicted metal-dependent hydrolase